MKILVTTDWFLGSSKHVNIYRGAVFEVEDECLAYGGKGIVYVEDVDGNSVPLFPDEYVVVRDGEEVANG